MAPLLTSLISGYRLRGGNMDNILGSSRRSVLAAGLAVSASWLVGRSQSQTPESVMTRPIPHSGEQLPIVGLGTCGTFSTTRTWAKHWGLRSTPGRYSGILKE